MVTLVLKGRLPAGSSRLARLAGEGLVLLRAYLQARRERAQLLHLGDRELHDIGLSRVDAVAVAKRPLIRDILARRHQGLI